MVFRIFATKNFKLSDWVYTDIPICDNFVSGPFMKKRN